MLRRLGMAVAVIVGVVLLTVLGALGYAQTGTGQAQLAALLTRQLSTPEQQVELAGLSGFVPFDIGLASLRLRDAQGVWLEVDDARLEVVASALFRGEIDVKQLGARRAALHRLPQPRPPPQPEPPFSLPKLPELPGSLPRVAVQRLFVDTFELGQPVLGEAATFTLGGNATTGADGRQARAELSLRRTDQPTAELALTAGLDLAAQSLSIDLTGSETGGLLAAASGRPEAGALRLSLVGQGPLSGWQGRLAVDAERLAKLDLAVDLAYAEQKRLTVTGALDAASGALPAELAEVIGTHAELAIRAGETAPGRYTLDDLRLQVASLSLQGAGSADLAADTVQGTLRLDAPDLARFAALAATDLAGARFAQGFRLGRRGAAGSQARPGRQRHPSGKHRRRASHQRLRRRLHRTARSGAGRPPGQGHRHDRRPDPRRPRPRRRRAAEPGARRRAAGQGRGDPARSRPALVPGRADRPRPDRSRPARPARRAWTRMCPSLPRCCRPWPSRPRWPAVSAWAQISSLASVPSAST